MVVELFIFFNIFIYISKT